MTSVDYYLHLVIQSLVDYNNIVNNPTKLGYPHITLQMKCLRTHLVRKVKHFQ